MSHQPRALRFDSEDGHYLTPAFGNEGIAQANEESGSRRRATDSVPEAVAKAGTTSLGGMVSTYVPAIGDRVRVVAIHRSDAFADEPLVGRTGVVVDEEHPPNALDEELDGWFSLCVCFDGPLDGGFNTLAFFAVKVEFVTSMETN